MKHSIFIVLYQPLCHYAMGIVAEWLIHYQTLPFDDEHRLHSIALPNKYNLAFDFGKWNRIVLVVYMYFEPLVLAHMLQQWRNKLPPGVL